MPCSPTWSSISIKISIHGIILTNYRITSCHTRIRSGKNIFITVFLKIVISIEARDRICLVETVYRQFKKSVPTGRSFLFFRICKLIKPNRMRRSVGVTTTMKGLFMKIFYSGILMLFFALIFNINFCRGQYVSSPGLIKPPMVSDPDVQKEAADDCEEASRVSTSDAVARARKMLGPKHDHCVPGDRFTSTESGKRICSMSDAEYLEAQGEKYFNMCNLINSEESSPCEDPGNFVGPAPALAGSCPCPGGGRDQYRWM